MKTSTKLTWIKWHNSTIQPLIALPQWKQGWNSRYTRENARMKNMLVLLTDRVYYFHCLTQLINKAVQKGGGSTSISTPKKRSYFLTAEKMVWKLKSVDFVRYQENYIILLFMWVLRYEFFCQKKILVIQLYNIFTWDENSISDWMKDLCNMKHLHEYSLKRLSTPIHYPCYCTRKHHAKKMHFDHEMKVWKLWRILIGKYSNGW